MDPPLEPFVEIIHDFEYDSLADLYNIHNDEGRSTAIDIMNHNNETNVDPNVEYNVLCFVSRWGEYDPAEDADDFVARMSFPINSISDIIRHYRDMEELDSDTIRGIVTGRDVRKLYLTLQKTTRVPAQNNIHQFRANPRNKFWGPLGKVNNCVIKQISNRVEGYLICGERRSFMWSIDGTRYSIDRLHPDYNASAAKKLSSDKIYAKIKAGVCTFLSRRDITHADSFGFDVRDLQELAELCDIRIMVFMQSRLMNFLRWDTDEHTSRDKGERYEFHFYMTSCQHLEMCDMNEITRNLDNSITWQGGFGISKGDVKYVDSEWFRSIVETGYTPDQPFRSDIFTIKRSLLRWPLPECAKSVKYGDLMLAHGNTIYKHECYIKWFEEIGLDPDDAKLVDVMCYADIHWQRLLKGMSHNNMESVKQQDSPSLYEAIVRSDKVTTHTLMGDVNEGDTLWEVDGRKWYHTDFSKVRDFPYFHGIPAASTWSEYSGEIRTPYCDPATGLWNPVSTFIGNGEGDRPFEFRYGKYAIFLIESLSFEKCDAHTMEHFTRDRLFVNLNPVISTVCLTSPIVHFLQDLGVVWRASYVWVCYGVVPDWIVGTSDEDALDLRMAMKEHKTYAISVGRLSSHSTIITSKHIIADGVTATDLASWHSTKFVNGETKDNVFDGVHRRHSPDAVLVTEDADVYGATTVSGSVLQKGSIYKLNKGKSMDKLPYSVTTHVDFYGYGSTRAHISGAIHSMCFIQLYRAALCIPPENIAGFSLDSIKCYTDPSDTLGSFISDSDDIQGSFKPAIPKTINGVYMSRTPLLSDMYTPRHAFTGISMPSRSSPTWGPYQDSLDQFNIITGPAGSGKTWRHLRKYGNEDSRVDKILYAPLTNYLAAQLKSQGIPSVTSFKAFNRRVQDENTVGPANERYRTDFSETRNRLKGFACVLRDEVTMDNAKMIVDAIDCCNAYHRQLLIVGDFDLDKFYQLSAVAGGGPLLMKRALESASTMVFPKPITWIPCQQVYRQAGDLELASLLDTLRNHNGDSIERWNCFMESPLFQHISYDELLERYNASKDLIISPWHKIISDLTDDVLEIMDDDSVLMLRGNFNTPYKTSDADPSPIQRLAVFEDDPMAHKAVTVPITKRELNELMGTKFMAKGFPYAASNDNSNMVNPMIGTTVFALQGISLESDSILYVLIANPGAFEWMSEAQPCQAYVTASRIRTRQQLVFVRKDRNVCRRIE